MISSIDTPVLRPPAVRAWARIAVGAAAGLLAWVAGASVVSGQATAAVADTALPIKLVGVITDSTAPARSTCLIKCTYPLETSGTYRPGQTACDVAEIREIGPTFIIVNNLLTNRFERLAFSPTSAPTGPPTMADDAVPAKALPLPPPVLKRSQDAVTVDLPEASVRHYLENLPALLDSALATPNYRATDGGPWAVEGFELSRIREGSVVEQMGFQNGDVVVELNGHPLASLASAITLFGQAQSMPRATLVVRRNSRRITFIFNRK